MAQGGGQSGAVYVFERVGGVWTETDFLLAPAPLANDRFGDSVALQGDTLVVGAPRSLANEPGHAFVFERVGGAWGVVAELSAPNAVEGDEFGTQVAIDGDVIAVGAWEDSSSRGACHVFRRNGGQWGLEETLRGSDTVHSDLFGWSVALEGDTIAVSALRGSGTRGAVFVFRHGPAGWSEEAKLTQYDNHVGDHLGSSVALSGDLLLAGTINDTEGRVGSGAGHLFERSGATWTHIGRFVPSDPSAHSWFGEQVALGTGVAVVSAFRDTSPTSVGGGVYVFHSPEGGVSNVCSATVGSSGAAARLTFNGSTSLAASDVTLHAIGAPAGTSALFFRGTEPAGVPLGAGVLCISPFTPGLARLVPAVPSDVHGTSIRVLAPADLPPGLLPGDSIYFQCMFRDMASPGPTIQLTDSLRVTFSG